jgi:hypothetical protein
VDVFLWSSELRCNLDGTPLRVAAASEVHSGVGGGTRPVVLLENPVVRTAMEDAPCFVLVTDGHIWQPDVEAMAARVPEATATTSVAVCVLVGSRPGEYECVGYVCLAHIPILILTCSFPQSLPLTAT